MLISDQEHSIQRHPSEIAVDRPRNTVQIAQIKRLADEYRWELGFQSQKAFEESASRSELIVAIRGDRAVGFVRFHHRKDFRTTIYEIVVARELRGKGLGRLLVEKLKLECRRLGSRSIRLSCPVELSANGFYAAAGFQRIGTSSKPGKNRPLYEWELTLVPQRPLVFVASLTACGSDLLQMIRLWEAHGNGRPFARCIVTPLFTKPGAFEHIRYIHERWGMQVIFNSGGFFVQQGKIRYEELFASLIDFYLRHPWADVYVLPDFVPTSRNTPAEVGERVHVTAAEGLKFLKRLLAELRARALGVLQGHEPEHLGHCFTEFTGSGVAEVGVRQFRHQWGERRDQYPDARCSGAFGFCARSHQEPLQVA
jgi:ribosomal protein S18 acetylase RimI-like enzyme